MANKAAPALKAPKPPRGGKRPAWRILDVEERPGVTHSVEIVIFAIACVLIMGFHAVLFCHTGAFWRDEICTLYSAGAPDLGTMWSRLANDSAPVVYYGALRLWIAAGLGGNDANLRLFGSVISLGIVFSLCISCWMFTSRAPLLAMSLVAFNAATFFYCSSLRAYGLAVLLIMPCCAAFWRLSLRPSRWNISASLVLALLSCHTSYSNTYLLLAIGLAGAGACAACRLWKRSALILAICFVTALSMLVYLPLIRNFRDVIQIAQSDVDMSAIRTVLTRAIAYNNEWLLSVWIMLAALAVACIVIQVARQWRSFGATPSLSLYVAILTTVAATVGTGFFIKNAMIVYSWHFTPFVAIAGMMMEVVFQSKGHKLWVWLLRTVVACVVMAISLPVLSQMSCVRRTNIDCAASKLVEMAGPKDLILLNPFWLMPTFNYYYHGAVEWESVPMTPPEIKTTMGGYATIKELMATPDPLAATLKKLGNTLKAGNKVWLVGRVTFPEKNQMPILLPPAPQSQFGWNSGVYANSWGLQLGYYVRWHGVRVGEAKLEVDQEVSDLEKSKVVVVEGWKESPPGVPELPTEPESLPAVP